MFEYPLKHYNDPNFSFYAELLAEIVSAYHDPNLRDGLAHFAPEAYRFARRFDENIQRRGVQETARDTETVTARGKENPVRQSHERVGGEASAGDKAAEKVTVGADETAFSEIPYAKANPGEYQVIRQINAREIGAREKNGGRPETRSERVGSATAAEKVTVGSDETAFAESGIQPRISSRLLSWAKEVLAGRATDAVRTIVAVPSAALKTAGFYRPVTLDFKHARHIMNTHPEITPEIIAALPDVMQRTRAVAKTGDSYVITVDIRVDGKPVVVVVRQETLEDGSKKFKVTGVATAFPQDNSASLLARALLNGDAVYAPEKEIARLRKLLALQPTGSIPVNPAEAGTAPQESNKGVRGLQPTMVRQNSERVVTIKTENGEVKFQSRAIA